MISSTRTTSVHSMSLYSRASLRETIVIFPIIFALMHNVGSRRFEMKIMFPLRPEYYHIFLPPGKTLVIWTKSPPGIRSLSDANVFWDLLQTQLTCAQVSSWVKSLPNISYGHNSGVLALTELFISLQFSSYFPCEKPHWFVINCQRSKVYYCKSGCGMSVWGVQKKL